MARRGFFGGSDVAFNRLNGPRGTVTGTVQRRSDGVSSIVNSAQGRNAAGELLGIGAGTDRVVGGTGARLLGEQRQLTNNLARSFGDSSFELGGEAFANRDLRSSLLSSGFQEQSRFSEFFDTTRPITVRQFPVR